MSRSPRDAALTVLERCRRGGAWSDAVLDAVLTESGLSGRDAALCTRLCTGCIQNAALCDFYIDCYSSVKTKKLEPKILDILRLGVYQLVFMDRIPAHAAVSQGVSQARRANHKAAGLVNAVLRRVSENLEKLPEVPGKGTAEHLAVKYSHPLWLCRTLIEERGYDFAEALLRENNAAPSPTAQVNTLKTTAAELREKLAEEGAECTGTKVPNALELSSAGDIKKLQSFRDGLFYIQDNAARMAVLTAGPKPGMRVLDACAAPGGKSFAAAIAMENRGEIVSCDIHEKKLARIENTAKRLGIDIISTRPMDARRPAEEFREYFDMVLADVPCSGIGVIRKKPDIRAKSEEDTLRFPEIQLDILRGLSHTVKPGGVLLYSTCTVLRRENEELAGAFLRENGDFALEGEMRTLFPNTDGTDGFFICKLRKKA
ncbi:MAG: 16S rRNA (cytosine(967)-C(5))-methyltransferase RsmB [Candidatus Heteroscillospira sp.]|jgi:16S rRNA (cytosine967-C5)-methyltransferase